MSKIVPLDGRVVLKGIKAEEKTKSGIILPGADKERPEIFEVIAVSSGKRLKNGKIQAHQLKPHQKVICSKYAGDDIKLDGEEYKIIGEDSVSAIVE